MIFLNLNLLAPEKKIHNERVIKFLFIKNMLEISILIAALLAISLLMSWMMLQEEFNNLSTSTILVNRGVSAFSREVREINKTTRNVVAAGKDYRTITPLLLEIVKSVPMDIKITAMNFDLANNKLLLSGIAKKREALLGYQEKIKENPWIAKIDSPSSQLFEKENINFELDITIQKETK